MYCFCFKLKKRENLCKKKLSAEVVCKSSEKGGTGQTGTDELKKKNTNSITPLATRMTKGRRKKIARGWSYAKQKDKNSSTEE